MTNITQDKCQDLRHWLRTELQTNLLAVEEKLDKLTEAVITTSTTLLSHTKTEEAHQVNLEKHLERIYSKLESKIDRWMFIWIIWIIITITVWLFSYFLNNHIYISNSITHLETLHND